MINGLWHEYWNGHALDCKSGSSGSTRTSTLLLNKEPDYCYPTLELNWSGWRVLLSRPPRPERGVLLAELHPDKMLKWRV